MLAVKHFNFQSASKFYDKNGTNKVLYAIFDQRAEEMKRIKSLGLDKLYRGIRKSLYNENDNDIIVPEQFDFIVADFKTEEEE